MGSTLLNNMMTINGVISVFKRPEYTYITLESLNRCNVVGMLNVTLLYEPTPEFDAEAIKALASKYPYIKEVVEETKYKTAAGMVRRGFELLKDMPDSNYYLYVENDILFNPDWFEQCVQIRNESTKKYRVGFCSPINGSIKNMMVEDAYRVKNGTPTGAILIDKDVLSDSLMMSDRLWRKWKICIDKRLSDYLRHNLGYKHITPHDSYAKHIGLRSINVGRIKDHTRRFAPNEHIMDLYEIAERINNYEEETTSKEEEDKNINCATANG